MSEVAASRAPLPTTPRQPPPPLLSPRQASVDSSSPGTPLGVSTAGDVSGVQSVSVSSVSSALHVSVSSASSSAHPLLGEEGRSSAAPTDSSYRSPSKWHNFDEDEDSEADSASPGPASPASQHSGEQSFARMDSHGGSSVGLEEGAGEEVSRHSSDTETKGLLGEDGLSECDALSISDSEDPYQITPEQRQYYTDHFRTLLQATGREVDLVQGAIKGSDDQVKEFFQKSSLSRDSLCKIWQLADVNQDGWLNLDEFTVAMHLIVLHVKGNLLIPDFLPPHIAPAVTPPRGHHPHPPGWTNFEGAPTGGSSSQSDGGGSLGGVSPSPKSREFTAVPPSAGTEKPIPQRRRPSQSPDQLTPREPPDTGPYGSAPTPPRRRTATAAAPLPTPAAHHPGPVPAATKAKTASLPLSPPTPAALPPSTGPKGPPPKPPPRPPHRSHGRSASLDLSKGGGPVLAGSAAKASASTGPPPSEPLPPAPLRDVESQTEAGGSDSPDVGFCRDRHSPPPMMDLEAGEEGSARAGLHRADSADEPKGSLQGRVGKLMKANAELEKERARLGQLRLHLEMSLHKMKEKH